MSKILGTGPYCPKCKKKLYLHTYDPDRPVCPLCQTGPLKY